MSDLLYILNMLVDVKGNILIPGINEGVEPLDEKEKELYTKIQYDIDAHIDQVGAFKPLKETKVSIAVK